MSEHLHHKLSVLHQNLLHGKLPRGLDWKDAMELVEHLGEVQAAGGDEFAFIIGKHRELFKRPHASELGIDEVSRLRKFLKTAEATPEAAEATSAESLPSSKKAVVIDHHGAHVYDYRDGGLKEEAVVRPYDPHHFHHHLIHRKEAHYQGDRVPEETSFYKEIMESLVGTEQIVLVGHGVGKSSAVNVLVDYLAAHRPDVAACVTAVETADLSALTEPEIEALAKQHLGIPR